MSDAVGISRRTIVVLGAGCSVGCGYPSAAQMLSQLEQFAIQLATSSGYSKVHECVDQTVELFRRYQKEDASLKTLDQLVDHLHREARSRPPNTLADERADQQVSRAKVAVAALFRSKEHDAIKTGLSGYRKLLDLMFGTGSGRHFWSVQRQTKYSVLSFNYDRCFELAFQSKFRWMNEAFYGPDCLNSGLYEQGNRLQKIESDRFAFIKLHGSVGFQVDDWSSELEYQGFRPSLDQPIPYHDDAFFTPGEGRDAGHIVPPLLVFPHELIFLKDYPNNRFDHREYIPWIANAVRQLVEQATDIWIVGYSCPVEDREEWGSILDHAVQCQRITVYDSSPDPVRRKLKRHLRGRPITIDVQVTEFDSAF